MESFRNFQSGIDLDGYRLLRPIGSGGFGTVWLAESEATKDFHAVKIVNSSQALEREMTAVRRFREFSRTVRSPHLIPIEHVNTLADALFYVLPLADGGPSSMPTDPEWIPDTLASRIEARLSAPAWFSSKEILDTFLPVARVVAAMNSSGLVHRDIKPANILFFGGRPCLADIGLLGEDTKSLSALGTPGHLPPSWYLESSGQPDMWGLATTLYLLLTGNHPDKIGRYNFRWPPQGEGSLSPDEHSQWERLHAAILRATEEKPHERFLTIQSFADACQSNSGMEHLYNRGVLTPNRSLIRVGIVMLLLGAIGWFFLWWGMGGKAFLNSKHQVQEVQATEIDLSGVLNGMDGSLNAVEKLGVQAEKLRQKENNSTDKKSIH